MEGLRRLLSPRSVAVIGGGVWCRNVVASCRDIGFKGAIWPVHPSAAKIGDVPVYPEIGDLPHPPDAVFVGVNRDTTVDVVAQLSEIGAGGAVCFASGFAEAEAELADAGLLQERLCKAAGNMPILGPNCYGFVNGLDRVALWPDVHGVNPCARGVAILTQSSNLAINLTMQMRGLPIAFVVTVGNQAQHSMAAIARDLIVDDRVTALGFHIEGIRDVPGFIALSAVASELGKPVVVLKVGTSDQAQAAVISHTASLAGSAAGAAALIERLGFAQVATPEVFLETLKLFHVTGGLASNRVVSASCSGGEASLMADMGQAAGLVFPDLETEQRSVLRGVLGPKVALANPLDYHTYVWGDQSATTACFSALARSDPAMVCIVLDFPRPDRFAAPDWDKVVAAVKGARAASEVPFCLISSLPENLPEAVAEDLIANDIVAFNGLHAALGALAAAASVGRKDILPDLLLPGSDRVGTLLTEASAKKKLAGFGVPLPRSLDAHTKKEALLAAKTLACPVVLKAVGQAHKTENGGVALNLQSHKALVEALGRMPEGPYLVEEMVSGGICELMVGITRDPAHGFVITLGAGGVWAELMADTQSGLLPVTAEWVTGALQRLRIAPVLSGYRGAKAVDQPAVIRAVLSLQDYALAHADRVSELEVNPLICLENGVVAVDALIMEGDPS